MRHIPQNWIDVKKGDMLYVFTPVIDESMQFYYIETVFVTNVKVAKDNEYITIKYKSYSNDKLKGKVSIVKRYIDEPCLCKFYDEYLIKTMIFGKPLISYTLDKEEVMYKIKDMLCATIDKLKELTKLIDKLYINDENKQ